MHDAVRLHAWWGNKIPPLLAVTHLAVLAHPDPMASPRLALQVASFLVACFGIGGIGYVLTDAFDVDEDRRIGKANAWARLAGRSRLALLLFLLASASLPWLWLPRHPVVVVLLALEMLLFIAYAVPPLRLKERGIAGIIADAAYAHSVPMLVAWLTFAPLLASARDGVTPALLLLWMLPMGMRHLARHQYDDLDRDRSAGVRTFAVRAGREATMRLVATRLLPVEATLALVTLAWLAPMAPLLLAGFVAHALWELHVVRRRWLAPLPPYARMGHVDRHDLYGQRILSGFVERWLAPLALASLVMHDPRALWMIPLHLLVLRAPMRLWIRSLRSLPRPLPS